MKVKLNQIFEKVNEYGLVSNKYRIKRFKTISGNIHAVIVDFKDDSSEIMVALSVLEDKKKYRLIEN
tara:strand:+ start:190 stop:390 length:201 start_codon:yes stop_codon:yes gene_type:complete